MSYWVLPQEESQKNNKRRSYECTHLSDIDKLPKINKSGEAKERDTVSPLPCSAGSDCLCLEDSSVWILDEETNEWGSI